MNKTQSEPSSFSAAGVGVPSPPGETFGPPGIESLESLTDGRRAGDFETRYTKSAWIQIALELAYLLLILGSALVLLFLLATAVVARPTSSWLFSVLGIAPEHVPLVVWLATGLSGACGGAAAALKWLYHSVAKNRWHRDRVIWRIVVPPLSAILSVFTGLMIVSGLLPFFSDASFSNPAAGAAFGFFVGFFSDNLLASLQKLAFRIFGTVDSK